MKQYNGMDYIRIDVASQFGMDKELFECRIKWVNDNDSDLEMLEEEADDYFRYCGAVMAYREAKLGVATGHLVGLDACSSGIQILSTLIGCKVGAANTGVTGQTRKDIYALATKEMGELLGQDMGTDRNIIKNALMTVMYGSTQEPINAFGKDTAELGAFYQAAITVAPGAMMLLEIFQDLWDEEALEYQWVMPDGHTVVIKSKKLMKKKIEMDTTDPHHTFTYQYKSNEMLEKGAKGSLCLPANIVHSIDGYMVRELTARCDYNITQLASVKKTIKDRLKKNFKASEEAMMPYMESLWKKQGILSIEGIEHIDTWTVKQFSVDYCHALLDLIRVIEVKPTFKVVSIHDEFKSHPNYMNYVRQTYIDLLAELADSDILDVILSEISDKKVHVEKISDDLSELIKEAEYPLA